MQGSSNDVPLQQSRGKRTSGYNQKERHSGHLGSISKVRLHQRGQLSYFVEAAEHFRVYVWSKGLYERAMEEG